jgi:hypothetical protein
MTKAEIMKWLLFVGSEPIEWTDALRKHPDSGVNPAEWHKDQHKQYQKFEATFYKWESDGFIAYTEEEIQVPEGKSYILRFYLTDKAKAKLHGKRRKA